MYWRIWLELRKVDDWFSGNSKILASKSSLLLHFYQQMDANIDASRLSNETSSCLSFKSKHKIFLSHSGALKDFVEELCEDLEDNHRFPFFDKRPSSLPKGERFSELILEAAQQCELAVVVVSEEYFTSRWPMIELSTFIQAISGSNPQLKILPLFFGLSIVEVGDATRQTSWFNEWSKWATDDARIKPMEFKNAVNMLQSFNGIEFNCDGREVGTYRKAVVASICSTISPDVKWDDSHIQGRSNLLGATREKIKRVLPSKKYGVHIFGFYGVGGIGKTTMCKTLCNDLSEFSGKVCHVELGANRTLEDLLKEVLRKLTKTSEELLQRLNDGECQNILWKRISWKQKIFLAIDNVWDDSKSIQQAKMFLEAPFHEGSVVMVTARSKSTLAFLGMDGSQCFEVPELGAVDARNLFLHHAAKARSVYSTEENKAIEQCIARCCFQKSKKQGSHYLPLALKVLGMHLACLGSDPADRLKSLPRVRDFNLFPEENPVFSIIRVNFDRLPVQEQTLFMDIALFNPLRGHGFSRRRRNDQVGPVSKWNFRYGQGNGKQKLELDLIGWLSLVHRQKLEVTETQVQSLKANGLLEDVDFNSDWKVSMHDLHDEFAKMESQGKLKSSSFKRRRWVYYEDAYPTDLGITPSGRCWENLVRLGIVNWPWFPFRVGVLQEYGADDGVWSPQGIQWKYCSNVVVLNLVGIPFLKGVLNLKDLRCLRSLELENLDNLDGLEGLEELSSLAFLQWFSRYPPSDNIVEKPYLGQLPASLKVLHVAGFGINLRKDVFARCINLCKLKLGSIRAYWILDFSQCTSLQSVELREIQGLQMLSGLAAGLTSYLKSLEIRWCKDLRDVSGLDHLVSLQHLELYGNLKLEKLPNLQKLTSLQVLRILEDSRVREVPGLGSLRQLRELRCWGLTQTRLPNLSGLKHLHYLELWCCTWLTTLEGVGDLPSLRHLNLCPSLVRLPDLSKSTNLEDLDITHTLIELGEEDIHILAKLPMLRPVKVAGLGHIKLDVVRREVLKYNLYGDTLEEERELETPPIKVHGYKF